MSDSCLNCGGLIMEPNEVYGYSGPVCHCPKNPAHIYQRPSNKEPMNNLPNVWIEKHQFEKFNCIHAYIQKVGNPVEYVPKEKLDIAVRALNEIAAWCENKEEVDSTFDEPWSARAARAALKELGE